MLDESYVSYCLKRNTKDILRWNTIINSHPHSEQIFSEAEHLIILLHSGLTEKEIDTELQHIQSKILLREAFSLDSQRQTTADNAIVPKRKGIPNKWLYTGVAASLLICVFLFFGNQSRQASPVSQLPVTTASSQTGSRKKVLLPDGSEVLLNSNSSVSWNAAFNENDRQIILTGSAFFKVAKNPQKPFVVHSGTLSTTALGTAFYIEQLPSANNIQVSLLEGKINVEQAGNDHRNIVYPGEEISYNISSRLLQKQKFDRTALQNWLNGDLSFTNTKLKDILTEISFWYNINIQLQNTSLADKPVTGSYKEAPLDDVLKVMSFSLGFTYTTNGSTVIIH